MFLILGVVLLLAIGTILDALHMRQLKGKATSVHDGDTETSVIAVLGAPSGTFDKGSGLLPFIGKSLHKQLVYGSVFDWHHAFFTSAPFFYPFRFRLFGPDSDDLVIVLDDNNRVLEVRLPNKE